MYRNGLVDSGAIQPAHITTLFVKAHVVMDRSHFLESSIDRAMRLSHRQALHTEADERSQPRLSTFNERVV